MTTCSSRKVENKMHLTTYDVRGTYATWSPNWTAQSAAFWHIFYSTRLISIYTGFQAVTQITVGTTALLAQPIPPDFTLDFEKYTYAEPGQIIRVDFPFIR